LAAGGQDEQRESDRVGDVQRVAVYENPMQRHVCVHRVADHEQAQGGRNQPQGSPDAVRHPPQQKRSDAYDQDHVPDRIGEREHHLQRALAPGPRGRRDQHVPHDRRRAERRGGQIQGQP